MKKLAILCSLFLLLAPSAQAASVLACGDNAEWQSSTAGGSCEFKAGLGQRLITVDDFVDSAADIVRIRVCADGACTTNDVTASATLLVPTSITIGSWNACDDVEITIVAVDQRGRTITRVLTEDVEWEEDTNEALTATSLCAAITKYVPGVVATLATETCVIVKPPSYRSVTVATDDATCATPLLNTTDATFSCSGSDEYCTRSLRASLQRLLTAETLSGFTVACSSARCTDDTIGFIPSAGTTELDVTIVNDANDPFGVVTTGTDGTVTIRNLNTLTGTIRFCGNGANATTPNYIGPILLSDYESTGTAVEDDFVFGGSGCDAKDSTTEATADLPFHAAFAIKPLSMVCATTCGTDDEIAFILRSATVSVPGMACGTTLTGSAVQCTVFDAEDSTIAAGATLAIRVVNNDDDDCSAGDVECILFYSYVF